MSGLNQLQPQGQEVTILRYDMHILKKAAILLSTSFGVGKGIYPCDQQPSSKVSLHVSFVSRGFYRVYTIESAPSAGHARR
jgi:hypothetical protein